MRCFAGFTMTAVSTMHLALEADGEIHRVDPKSLSTRQVRLAQLESQAKSMIGTKLSPDAKSVINDVLLPTIEGEIETAISREFDTVQEHLTELVDALDAKTKQAVTSKGVADTQDSQLDYCRSNEKTALDQYESCETERASKIASDAQHCQAKRDAAAHVCAEKDAAADLTFTDLCAPKTCNLANGDTCGMEEFTKAVEGMNAMVKQKQNDYIAKIQLCNAADQEAADVCAAAEEFAASDSCKEQREQAHHQQTQCESEYGQAKVAICSFGTALQDKCVDLSEVRSLIAKIKASDRTDSLSESDRQHEWQAVQRLSCLLKALRDEGDLSQEAAATCAASRPYPHTFDYLDARIAELTTAENFTCDETSMTFSGYWWSVGDTSSDFAQIASHPALSLQPGTPAFSICGGFTVNPDELELVGSPAVVTENKKLAEIHVSQDYEVSFVIKPDGVGPNWRNVIHFTVGENHGAEGDRVPAVWFYSDATKLHIKSTRKSDVNDGCDPEQHLPMHQETTVTIRVAGGEMNVLFDGTNVCKNTNYGDASVVTKPVTVYAADPWYPNVPDATVGNLVYRRLP
mmetsp:Transcript_252/g.560  ORF Transcript_252/g.560 Transcript_252/m.560 type:complete len:575 (+) Transcript_252:64-1788(+)